MGLEFKHFVYVVALGSVIWAVAVAAIVSYEDVSESVVIQGELNYERSGGFFQNLNKLDIVQQALNVVLPLGLLCIGYLLYTYKINPIGLGSIMVVMLAFLFATDSVLDAANSVERDFQVQIETMVWWLPED